MDATATIDTARTRAAGAAKAAQSLALLVAGAVTEFTTTVFADHVKDPVLLKVGEVSKTETGQKLLNATKDATDTVVDTACDVGGWLVDRKDDVEGFILDNTTLTQRRVTAGVILTGGVSIATVLVVRRRKHHSS